MQSVSRSSRMVKYLLQNLQGNEMVTPVTSLFGANSTWDELVATAFDVAQRGAQGGASCLAPQPGRRRGMHRDVKLTLTPPRRQPLLCLLCLLLLLLLLLRLLLLLLRRRRRRRRYRRYRRLPPTSIRPSSVFGGTRVSRKARPRTRPRLPSSAGSSGHRTARMTARTRMMMKTTTLTTTMTTTTTTTTTTALALPPSAAYPDRAGGC